MKAKLATDLIIERFLEMISAERGAAENTLTAYAHDLKWANETLQSRHSDLMQADAAALIELLQNLADNGFEPTSQARRLSCLRQFYQFLYLENLRHDNPAADLDSPRRRQTLPKIMTEAQVTQLLNKAAQEAANEKQSLSSRQRTVRLWTLVEMLYASGLRISELVSLPLNAVKGQPRLILIKGKGGRERLVPMSHKANDALIYWLDLRQRSKYHLSHYLFPASSQTGYIARQVVARELKALAVRANIDPQSLSPHLLRHAFASHLLAHGADLRSLQQLLGHADIATTQIYTHVLEERLAKLVNDLHPLSEQNSQTTFSEPM